MIGLLQSFFSLRTRKRIRLRHVLHLTILVEQRATAFYKKIVELIIDEQAKSLFVDFAQEDERRLVYVQELLRLWRKLKVTRSDYSRLDPDKELRCSFDLKKIDTTDLGTVLKYALDQEENVLAFFERVEQELQGEGAGRFVKENMRGMAEARAMWKTGNLDSLVEATQRRIARLGRLSPAHFQKRKNGFMTDLEQELINPALP